MSGSGGGARHADPRRAAGWGVERGCASAANSVIAHKPSGRTTTYGKVAEAAAKLDPPKDIN